MSEQETFLKIWNDEYAKTMRVLKEYPHSKQDLKPADKLRTAKDLAWVFVSEQEVFLHGVLQGKMAFDKLRAAPATLADVLTEYETHHKLLTDKLAKMPESDFNSEMDFFVGPNQMAKLRRADIMWFVLFDMIHHRGQFSVYNRLAGAKVPSIYGPSADEPWM